MAYNSRLMNIAKENIGFDKELDVRRPADPAMKMVRQM